MEKTRDYVTKLIFIIAVAMSLYHLYAAFVGITGIWRHRALHLGFAFLLTILQKPLYKEGKSKILIAVDVILFIVSIAVTVYCVVNYDAIMLRQGANTKGDKIVTVILILLTLEMTRRIVGMSMVIIAGVFLVYLLFGNKIPGTLGHPKYSATRITDQFFNTTGGIFGSPLGAASVQIIIFVIFGAFLNRSGGGEFFSKLAKALAGRSLGGPAKTAVFASALFGTLSGSAVANVATTGAFTIPVMKKCGFKPSFAGAVEAAASTGGQITPPVLGATAFIIAEITSTPYAKIILYTILPAVLYYTGIYFMIHFEAGKNNLTVSEDEEIPGIKETLLEGGHYLIAIVILLVTLSSGMSSVKSGAYSIVALILLSFIRKDTRMTPKQMLEALQEGALNTITISITCATAGIIVGCISLSGLGLKLSAAVISLANGKLLLALLFTAIASLILGMGMVSISAYIILASLAAPAIVKLGVPVIAAHLFVYFFGILSNVTPPVAIAAYTAAGLAGANQTETAVTATKLTASAFIIPFMFALDQRLLLIGAPLQLILPFVTAVIGVVALSAGLQGWLFSKINAFQRAAFILGALMFMYPTTITDLIGLALLLVGGYNQYPQLFRKQKA